MLTSIRDGKLWENWGPAASALLTALVLGLAFTAFVIRYEADRLLKCRSDLKDVFEPRCNALSLAIAHRVSLLHGLRAYIESELSSNNEELDEELPNFASILHGGIEGVRVLAIAPGGVYTHVWPVKGNERLFGRNLLTDRRPEVRRSVDQALATRAIVLSHPYKLSVNGELGVVARLAIYRHDAFWGIAAAAIELHPLLKSSGIDDLSAQVSFAMRRHDGEIFFGSSSVFEGDPIVKRIDLPGQYWEIGARPANGWTKAVEPEMAPVRTTGVLVVLLASSLAYLLVGRHTGLTRAVRMRTEELARSNERIRESERNLAVTLDAIGEGVIATDPDGKIVLMNPAAERLTGWLLSEAAGNSAQTLFKSFSEHEDQAFRLSCDTASGSGARQISTLRTKGGGERVVWNSASSIRDENGEAIGAVLVFRDITSEYEARLALKRSERLFRTLVQASPLAIVSLTPEGDVTSWNEAAERMFGWRSSEVIGEPIPIIPSSCTEQCRTLQRRAASGEAFFNSETVRKSKDGSLIDISLSVAPFRSETGQLEGIITISLDITERKRAEQALRASEERLRLAMKGASDGLWDWDLKSNEVYYSPRWKSMLGYGEDELSNHLDTWKQLVHPDDRESTLAIIAEIIAGLSDKYELEFRMRHKSGCYVDILSRAALLRDERGEVFRLVGTHVDITERKRAEKSLLEREAKLRTIFSATSVGIGMAVDRTFQEVNDAMCRLTGYSRDELLGQSTRILYASDEAYERIGQERYDLMSEDSIGTVETSWRRKDGAIREIVLSSTPLDSSDPAKGVIFTALDITRRKHAEQALRDSEYFLRKSQEVAGLGSYCFEAKTGRWVSSGTLDSIFGIDSTCPKDVEGWLSVVHPEQREAMHRFLTEQVLLGRNSFDKEYAIIRPSDGEERWVHGIGELECDENNDPIRMVGTVQDITERRQTERALRENEERLRLAQAAANQGLFDLNVQTGEAMVSPEYATMLGYAPEAFEETKSRWIENAYPGDRERVAKAFRDYLRGELPVYSVEHRQRTCSGEWKWILSQGKIVSRDSGGKPLRMLGICMDVTEKKLAQEEKAKLESQLIQAQKLESIGRLAGGVAHDFNNLLSVVLGYSELIESRLPLDDPMLADIQEIKKAATTSRDITRQLLAFSRKEIISPKVLNLNEHIRSTQKTLTRLIGEDILLHFHPGPDLGAIEVDPSQLDQIIMNLCVNARDAMPNGGRLTIQTSNQTIDRTYCSGHADFSPGEYVLLEICDEGTGMDEQTLSQIFEPFFTTKALGRGTGLGLATVYGIVKQHGGFINAYSELGHGATFKVYFPRVAAEVSVSNRTEPAISPASGTVLLVEDAEAVRRLITTMLETLGYRVLAAASPLDALAIAEDASLPIDLLITDVVMPGMNGAELRDEMATARPEVDVLFMSGYTADVIASRGVLQAGVHFIQKPFSLRDLALKVREVNLAKQKDPTDGFGKA